MDAAISVVFLMEEASTGEINDASNSCGIEEAPTCNKILNADDHSNLLKSPMTKVTMTRKVIASTFI